MEWRLRVAGCYRRSGEKDLEKKTKAEIEGLKMTFYSLCMKYVTNLPLFHQEKSFCSAGNYHAALETYKETHGKFPEDIECNSNYISSKRPTKNWFIRTKRDWEVNCVAQVWPSWWGWLTTWAWRRCRSTPTNSRKPRRWEKSASRFASGLSLDLVRFTWCCVLSFTLS